ncbi:cell division protein CrgA [Bifidobacterium canis]|uniref:Cell division protein CrgA n=1 Tax=Bifidobacterium canis TaxID=2610880 RepID=A0A7K1J446_9BIFI|nr:cell division protein CrgA [Bifidobacterium canis]MUH59320.1 septation inhibitor protein [Bifidobacterium canis]
MAEEELHKTDADGQISEATADETATVTDDVVVDADSEGDAVAVESEEVAEEPVHEDRKERRAEEKAERKEAKEEAKEEREAEESEEAADDISLDKIQDLLNSTVDEKDMTPQMRRMVRRQQENTKRVEDTIKGTKANPSWYVPLFCAFMIIGLIWVVVFYLTAKWPIPGIGNWNLLIGFALIMVGFLMTVAWR